ncbi:MAG: hypothetical protein QF464_00795 [Myxococcota bacterium]|nr:hypothetical protein [Myxococcota bacterium]
MSPDHLASGRSTTKRVILAGMFALYLAGYPVVRWAHLLVHAKTYAGAHDPDGPVVVDHGIRPGDFGTPMLGPMTTLATLAAGLAYWPIRHGEVLYWNIVEPPGSPYDGPVAPPPNPDLFPPAPHAAQPPGPTPP